MPAFEIYYLDNTGDVACAFSVQFEDVLRAKILAHAMKPAECHTLEVWQGKELVYRRPEMETQMRPALTRLLAERQPVIA